MAASPHYKLVVVGDGTVGKTSLLISFAKNEFPEKYVPTVFDNTISLISVDQKTYELELWDTAGQEDYDRLRPLSYPDSHLILVVFALNNNESYKNVEAKWIKEVRMNTQAPVLLVGTKVDLRDDANAQHVSTARAKQLQERIQAIDFIETSAKTRYNVNMVFEEAVRHLTGKKKDQKPGGGGCCELM